MLTTACVAMMSNTSMKTEDLFGSGIPSSPDVAMSASWMNDLLKEVFFLKNDQLYKTQFSSTIPAVEIPTGQIVSNVGRSLCGVTAVVTGINKNEYILLRGSYVFDINGQSKRVCLPA